MVLQKIEASVVCVDPQLGFGNTCQGGALAHLGYPKALGRKTVKATAGEA